MFRLYCYFPIKFQSSKQKIFLNLNLGTNFHYPASWGAKPASHSSEQTYIIYIILSICHYQY